MILATPCLGASLFLSLLCAGSLSSAQDLAAYQQEMRANNAAYQAAMQRWQAADAVVETANTLPDPMLGFGIFLQEVETRVGPQKQRLSLSQRLPWFGKLSLAQKQAQAQAYRLRAEVDSIGLRLDMEFKELYAELFYLGKAIAITTDHLQLLMDLESVVTERYENSAAKYSDLIQIQIEIDALRDSHITQKAAALPVMAEMNALLGRPRETPLPFPTVLPDITLPADFAKDALALLRKHNPMLVGLGFQIEADQTAVALAKKNFYPDFTVGLDWINTGEAIMANQRESGKDPLILSVGVNLPIWRKKYRAQEVAANYRAEASTHQQRDTLAHLEARLKQALFQWDEATRRKALYRNQIIPKAEESLRVLTTGFQTGDSTYLDLISAEKALLDFLLSLERSHSNQLKALASIEALVGKEFTQSLAGGMDP